MSESGSRVWRGEKHKIRWSERSAKLGENMKEAFIETFRREQKRRGSGQGARKCNSVWLSCKVPWEGGSIELSRGPFINQIAGKEERVAMMNEYK